MIRFPSGEIVSVPQHVNVKNLDVVMDACALVHIRLVASLMAHLGPVTAPMLRTPVKSLLGKIVGKLPEGPDDGQRRSATWTVMALAYGADGRPAHGVTRGSDTYDSTATMCVEGARRLVIDDAPAGVLAPAQAFDPTDFLGFLAAHGADSSVRGDHDRQREY